MQNLALYASLCLLFGQRAHGWCRNVVCFWSGIQTSSTLILELPCSLLGPGHLCTLLIHQPKPGKGAVWPGAASFALTESYAAGVTLLQLQLPVAASLVSQHN